MTICKYYDKETEICCNADCDDCADFCPYFYGDFNKCKCFEECK